MDYLVNTRIEDLNTRLLNLTIHDFETRSDMHDKMEKFNSFSRSNPPSANYLFGGEMRVRIYDT